MPGMEKVRGQVSWSHISSQGRPGTIQGLEGSADFLVRGGHGGKANAALGWAVVEIGWVWRQDGGIWGGASQSGSARWGGRRVWSWQDGEALPSWPEAGL